MSFQSLFRSHKTDGEWQLRRGGSLLWKCGEERRLALASSPVQSRNLCQVLTEDSWQSWQVLEGIADDKEQKCSLESKEGGVCGQCLWKNELR